MKKIWCGILLTLFLFSISSQASNRVVLAEMFTNTGCPPCGPADDTLDQIAEDYSARLAIIRYHTWWPSTSDPFYQANPSENTARINYYATNYTPRLLIDGTIDGQYLPEIWRNLIQQRTAVSSPLKINLSGTIDTSGLTGSITAEIIAVDSVDGISLKIRYAIIESEIYYPWPYGSPYHNQTFRDMFPSTVGVPISISMGDTVVNIENFSISSSWAIENCDIVVFVQDDGNKSVLQAAKIPVLSLTHIKENSRDFKFNSIFIHPNPSKASVEFSILLKNSMDVSLILYNSLGQRVYTLFDGYLREGIHHFRWDRRDSVGRKVSSGVYWLRIESIDSKITKKIILIR